MFTPSDKLKLGRSQYLALEALKKAGDKGLDTMQLIAIAGSRAPARVWELGNLGHIVKKERVAGDRLLWRYTYLGFSASNQIELFKAA